MTVDANRTRVELDEAELDDLAARLARARLSRSDTSTWARGTSTPWLAELIADWRAFDPGRLQGTLDQLTHIEVTLDGLSIHAGTLSPGSSRNSRASRPDPWMAELVPGVRRLAPPPYQFFVGQRVIREGHLQRGGAIVARVRVFRGAPRGGPEPWAGR